MKQLTKKQLTELAVPFTSEADANESLNDFFDAIQDLRVKYRMKNVLVAVSVSVEVGEDRLGEPMVTGTFGDEWEMEKLAAYAAGRTGALRQAAVDAYIREGASGARRRQENK